MNNKKAKRLRKQFKEEYGRSPRKAEAEFGLQVSGVRHRPLIQTQVDEFRKYKKRNK